ncbi:MAG: YdbC family protein [Treponemataceae bacterium]
MADDFSYTVEKNLGVLSTSKSGWTVELNLVSWNGRPAKYDIRPWAPDHEKMGKGISLTKEEILALKGILENLQ